VTVAAALLIGSGVAGAKGGGSGGGGTNPNQDTGTPPASATTTTTGAQGKSTVAPDARATPADAKGSRDLGNSPGGAGETTVPNANTARH